MYMYMMIVCAYKLLSPYQQGEDCPFNYEFVHVLMSVTSACILPTHVAVLMEGGCVLGWGRTTEGQLGLGGIEETTIKQPR